MTAPLSIPLRTVSSRKVGLGLAGLDTQKPAQGWHRVRLGKGLEEDADRGAVAVEGAAVQPRRAGEA